MTRPLVFSEHAVRRYAERYAPWLPLAEARAELERAGASALPTGEKTRGGQPVWMIPEPLARLVVKRDRGYDIAVTVLFEPPGLRERLGKVRPGRGRRRR